MAATTSNPTTVLSAGSWTGVANVYVSDDVAAEITLPATNTDYPFEVGGFNFSAIPDGSTINTLTVSVENRASSNSNNTMTAELRDGTTVIGATETLAVGTTDTARTFTRTPTLAQVRSSGLRVRVIGRKSTTQARSQYVDHVTITVDYTAPLPAPSALPVVWPTLTTRADHSGISIPGGSYLLNVTAASRDAFLDQVVTLGAKWLRFDIPLEAVESGALGARDWSNVDAAVIAAKSRGLYVLCALTTLPRAVRTSAATNAGYSAWQEGPTSTAQRNAYRDACVDAAVRYNGSVTNRKVDAWELWNEPNLDAFWAPTPSTADFGALIALTYPAMRAVTSAPILPGGTGGTSGSAPNITTPNWYSALHAGGFNAYWDAVNMHPYQNLDVRTSYPSGLFSGGEYGHLPTVRTQMVNAGDSAKKIWGTESGFPATPDGVAGTGSSSRASFAEQAAWFRPTWEDWEARAYTGVLFAYHFHDHYNSSNVYRGWGVYLEDKVTKKPVYDSWGAWLTNAAPPNGAGGSGGGSVGLSETFTGTNGAPWPDPPWTTETTGVGMTISNSEGLIDLGAAVSTRGRAVASGMSPVADGELLMSFQFSDTSGALTRSYLRPFLRGSGTWFATSIPHEGHGIEVQSDSPLWRLYQNTGGVSTEVASFTDVVPTGKRWLRMRLEGTTLSVRTWADGATEPTTWNATAAVSGAASGVFQMTSRKSSGATSQSSIRVDNLTVTDLAAPPPSSLVMIATAAGWAPAVRTVL